MRKLFALFLIAPTVAFGYQLNPVFEAQQSEYGAILIEWKTVENPQQVCNRGSKQARNVEILACSVRYGIRCTIYTKRELSLAMLGHEMRHCYEGEWHTSQEHLDRREAFYNNGVIK